MVILVIFALCLLLILIASIFCFVNSIIVAGLILLMFFLLPLIIMLIFYLRLSYIKRHHTKRSYINYRYLLWFFFVFLIGCGGLFLFIEGFRLDNNVLMLVFGSIFTAAGVIATVAIVMNITSWILLANVNKHGKEAVGVFLELGGPNLLIGFRGRTYFCPPDRTFNPEAYSYVKFKFFNGQEWIETKTNLIYTYEDAKFLEDKKEFKIKYIKKRAVITEPIILEKKDEKEKI